MNILDTSDKKPDSETVGEVYNPIPKQFVDVFKKLKCQFCGTHLNGATICPSCKKAKE